MTTRSTASACSSNGLKTGPAGRRKFHCSEQTFFRMVVGSSDRL